MARRGRIGRKTYFSYGGGFYLGRKNGDGTVDIFTETNSDSPINLATNWKFAILTKKVFITVLETEVVTGTL